MVLISTNGCKLTFHCISWNDVVMIRQTEFLFSKTLQKSRIFLLHQFQLNQLETQLPVDFFWWNCVLDILSSVEPGYLDKMYLLLEALSLMLLPLLNWTHFFFLWSWNSYFLYFTLPVIIQNILFPRIGCHRLWPDKTAFCVHQYSTDHDSSQWPYQSLFLNWCFFPTKLWVYTGYRWDSHLHDLLLHSNPPYYRISKFSP